MNLGNLGGNLLLVAFVIGLLFLIGFITRGMRKPVQVQKEVVQDLLAETRLNQAVLEYFRARQEPKKFTVTGWKKNSKKVGFLSQPTQDALSDSFTMAEDFNRQVEAGRKHRSAGYIADLNVDKLKELLVRSQEGLEEWLVKNIGRKEPPLEYPGLFDGFFGKRR